MKNSSKRPSQMQRLEKFQIEFQKHSPFQRLACPRLIWVSEWAVIGPRAEYSLIIGADFDQGMKYSENLIPLPGSDKCNTHDQ